MNVTVFALVGGFLLCMASALADVHIVSRVDQGIVKQVGFLYAPNWVITFLILFPLYLMMFSILIRKRKKLLRLLADSRAIVRADGSPVGEDALPAYWSKFIARVSLVLWAFVLVVLLQSTQEWAKSCLMPLLAHDTGDRAVDWSLIAARSGNEVWIWRSILFTAFAYVYMGFALFIYLAVMLYGVAISAFVNQLSETPDELRMTRIPPPIMRELRGVATSVYACTFLGLCAAYVMRLQAGYLPSPYPNVVEFFFSRDLVPLFAWLGWTGPAPDTNLHELGTNSQWTSLLVAAYALAMFMLSTFLLNQAVGGATGQNDRPRDGATGHEISESARTSGLATLLPRYKHLFLVLLLAAASCVFVGTGTLWIATLVYAGWALAMNSAAARRGADAVARGT